MLLFICGVDKGYGMELAPPFGTNAVGFLLGTNALLDKVGAGFDAPGVKFELEVFMVFVGQIYL